jgi:hypothetical protein
VRAAQRHVGLGLVSNILNPKIAVFFTSPASVRRRARLCRRPASARTAVQRDGRRVAPLLRDRSRTRTERSRSTARQAYARSHQRARTGWARHTTRARKALVRWRGDRTDPSTANAQPARSRMRLRPRLLVQAYRARPCREVVVPRPLLRSPAQEPRSRRMSPSAKASARADGRGALLPGAGGRASSAERPDRRQVVSPDDARVRRPRAR